MTPEPPARAPFRPAPRVGIVGGGQLARMTYGAALRLGLEVVLLASPSDEAAPAAIPQTWRGPLDAQGLAALAREVDVVTFDHELVEPEAVRAAEAAGGVVRPSSRTLAVAAHKLEGRRLMGSLGLPVPPFAPVASAEDVERFAAGHGWPLVVKSARGGYDGRGVWVLEGPAQARDWMARMAGRGPFLAEPQLPLERELAVLVARRPGGEAVVYPVVETVQVDGMCREVRAPAPVSSDLAAQAQDLALRLAAAVDAVGILAVELFLVGGRLMVNELAPRPHNSGHYSLEGAVTSQFENHLRGVLDLPLGPTDLTAGAAAMVNVVGTAAPGDPRQRLAAALALGPVHLHLYGKAVRPGRKLGHVTVLGADPQAALALARRAAAILSGEEPAP